jgi:Ran GTPase-activating protein (RanGAP) involved in mRNA processing and transport
LLWQAALEASVTQLAEPEFITINVQTLSGILPPVTMSAQATVRDLKQRLQTLSAEFGVDRQKLLISAREPNEAGAGVLLLDHRSLESCNITDGMILVLVVLPSIESEVCIDVAVNDPDRLKAMLENRDLHAAAVDVSSICRHFELLSQLFEENRGIRSIKISGRWTESILHFCQYLMMQRPDVDIRCVLNGSTDETIIIRVVQCCALNRCSFIDLSTVYFGDAICRKLAPTLQSMSSLQTLKLSIVGDAVCAVLKHVLESMSSLHTLYLEGYRVTESGFLALANALKSISSLQSLRLGLKHSDLNRGICQQLASALTSMSSLQSLNLSRSDICVAEFVALATGLKSKSSLKILDLSCNKIGTSGGRALENALKSMPSLQKLNLSNNRVGTPGCRMLAQSLHSMLSLESLNLSFNKIDVSGCVALASALQLMSSLLTLDLSNNYIDNEGCMALGSALQTMSALQTLDLSNNKMSATGCRALVPTLKLVSSLKTLNLSGIVADDEEIQALRILTSAVMPYLELNNEISNRISSQ